ncbi:MAG: peptidoglycan bridge formation glycyltransferase FemA/FemB family protein [Treponema sp.]|jgi:lipid II:glycine glycyltransferase (peptidoglycan interpeptide bridge formation enzyme)|nr:peptidoglycan bridge formation glycyltransferase FemA/FemB family protein [Treponema sp.]
MGGREAAPAAGASLPGQYLRGLFPADLAQCNRAASFLQSGFWGSFKARFGWNARGFLAEWGEWDALPLLVIRRRLAPGISFAYIPWGPELPEGFPQDKTPRNRALEELVRALRSFLPKDTAFIRIDPPWYTEGADTPPPPVFKPLIRAGADVQPPDTVLVDLSPPEDEILRRMKPKGRYNIRLATKKGVKIRRADEGGLESFYTLLQETSKRDGIAIHGIDYYRVLFAHCRDYPSGGQELPKGPDIRLYLAEEGRDVLAAVIILIRGKNAVYLYGASSDQKRNFMAPYALQWKAMVDAKAAGCVEYDLFGIPPREDPRHPMAGLYRFKTSFGGWIIHRPGSWDYAYKPLAAGLFIRAERLRKKTRDIKKFLRGRNPDH